MNGRDLVSRAGAARVAVLLLMMSGLAVAQASDVGAPTGWADDPPALASLVSFAHDESDLRIAVTRYLQDIAALERRYPVPYSPAREARLMKLHEGWQARLGELDFAALNFEGQLDYIALRNRIQYNIEKLRLEQERGSQMAALLPFADSIRLLQEQRFDRKRIEPRSAGATLDAIAKQASGLARALKEEAERKAEEEKAGQKPAVRPKESGKQQDVPAVVARRAAEQVLKLREVLQDWNRFYDGYDPTYSWWSRKPFADADAALQSYADAINEHLAGVKPGEKPPIIGDPALAPGLRADLAVEMIPYTPQELVSIGEQEFEWIEQRLREVSRRMGFGDEWKAALEHTKNLAPPPGEVPWVIYDIANYSETFIEKQHSITLAPLAREIWRLAMQTPERQLVNPFFSGGEVTHLSYPTDGMTFEERLMSMRGNTPHFNFPTVQHEIVPGHHYQRFINDRFNSHRAELNDTPFWREGWALYWELQLWDRDFARNDPDRIGMLFWRLHRAGRIVFSLNYQLGNWSPQQAIDFLVDRVGHERANAEAEVRRTTIDAPLYQTAYMTGALQLRALYQELVDSGRMSPTAFHDAVLLGGPMPIELVRARLTRQSLTKDFRSRWRFYDALRR
jgi:uncharacterized protein DUF885